VIQVSYSSVKELLAGWFTRQKCVVIPHPSELTRKVLAQVCVSTLIQLAEGMDNDGPQNDQLAFYAAQSWVYGAHVENARGL
jgi:hypothetical protein